MMNGLQTCTNRASVEIISHAEFGNNHPFWIEVLPEKQAIANALTVIHGKGECI